MFRMVGLQLTLPILPALPLTLPYPYIAPFPLLIFLPLRHPYNNLPPRLPRPQRLQRLPHALQPTETPIAEPNAPELPPVD